RDRHPERRRGIPLPGARQILGVLRLRFASLRMTLKKVGIFGGTFDPIHHGHLILAREALEALALDLVVFIPAAASPHKPDFESAGPVARLEMVRAAIEGEPRFGFDPMELERPWPSYAIGTVEVLRKRQPEAQSCY